MVIPDETSNAGQLAVPAEDAFQTADDTLEFFPSDFASPPEPVTFDVQAHVHMHTHAHAHAHAHPHTAASASAPTPIPTHARMSAQARAMLADWWLVSRTLAWRFDTRMAEYEYQLEDTWDRHIVRHLPSSEDREIARLAARVRLWQVRTGGLRLARRFDDQMADWEAWIESETRDLGQWSRARLTTAWAYQTELLHRADARTRASAGQLLRHAQALRRVDLAIPKPRMPEPRRERRPQPPPPPQARPAPATRTRTRTQAQTQTQTQARPRPAAAARASEISPITEVSAPPSLRERALDAWQAAQAEQASLQRRRHLEEIWVLRQLLHERLGVLVMPETRRVEIDGLQFTVRWRKAAAVYELVLVTTCRECGAPAISGDIRNLADLGVLVSGRPDVLPLCPDCRTRAQAAPDLTTAERLVEDIRELAAEEIRRQQVREIGRPSPAQRASLPLPPRRVGYRRSS